MATTKRKAVKRRKPVSKTRKRTAKRSSRKKFFDFREFIPWTIAGVITAFGTMTLLHQNSMQNPGRAISSVRVMPQPVEKNTLFDRIFQSSKDFSVNDKIDYWSQEILKGFDVKKTTPEGLVLQNELISVKSDTKILDHVPLVAKELDCTTYVEVVLALAKSKTLDEFSKNLIRIRYSGTGNFTDYFHRNHFPEADWLPNNISSGVLTDITQKVSQSAGMNVLVASKTIDRGKWYQDQIRTQRLSRALASELQPYYDAQWGEPVTASVNYIPLEKFADVQAHIPSGSILNIVRKSLDKYPVLISHQGFVIKRKDGLYFRHASRTGRIKTVPLQHYLEEFAQTAEKAKWPVLGFNLLSM